MLEAENAFSINTRVEEAVCKTDIRLGGYLGVNINIESSYSNQESLIRHIDSVKEQLDLIIESKLRK